VKPGYPYQIGNFCKQQPAARRIRLPTPQELQSSGVSVADIEKVEPVHTAGEITAEELPQRISRSVEDHESKNFFTLDEAETYLDSDDGQPAFLTGCLLRTADHVGSPRVQRNVILDEVLLRLRRPIQAGPSGYLRFTDFG
jgi:hypothetical protein